MKLYRKKPIPVEVVQFTEQTINECRVFVGNKGRFFGMKDTWFGELDTEEGCMNVADGSYIVKGAEGEFWAVKKSIFEKTYELVEEDFSLDDYIGKR